MSRIIGHANSVKTMIEEHRDCTEILIQISAVKSALNNLGKKILEDHINKCIVDVVGEEQLEEKQKLLEDLNDAKNFWGTKNSEKYLHISRGKASARSISLLENYIYSFLIKLTWLPTIYGVK